MTESTSPKPAGAGGASRFAGLIREAPYLLLIVLGLIGIGWTSVSRTPTTTYWIVLTPVAALISIAAGWRHCPSNADRLRMVASQALHWAAFLLAMILVTVSDVHGMLNFDAAALMLLTLLALGVFTAGLSLWSWKLCVTGAVPWPRCAAACVGRAGRVAPDADRLGADRVLCAQMAVRDEAEAPRRRR